MTPLDAAWAFLWLAICWAFYVLAVVGALILIFAFIVGLLKGWRDVRPKRITPPREKL